MEGRLKVRLKVSDSRSSRKRKQASRTLQTLARGSMFTDFAKRMECSGLPALCRDLPDFMGLRNDRTRCMLEPFLRAAFYDKQN